MLLKINKLSLFITGKLQDKFYKAITLDLLSLNGYSFKSVIQSVDHTSRCIIEIKKYLSKSMILRLEMGLLEVQLQETNQHLYIYNVRV